MISGHCVGQDAPTKDVCLSNMCEYYDASGGHSGTSVPAECEAPLCLDPGVRSQTNNQSQCEEYAALGFSCEWNGQECHYDPCSSELAQNCSMAVFPEHHHDCSGGGGGSGSSSGPPAFSDLVLAYDADGDGMLSRAEWHTLYAALQPGHTAAEADAFFDTVDADHDGFITQTEWDTYFAPPPVECEAPLCLAPGTKGATGSELECADYASAGHDCTWNSHEQSCHSNMCSSQLAKNCTMRVYPSRFSNLSSLELACSSGGSGPNSTLNSR